MPHGLLMRIALQPYTAGPVLYGTQIDNVLTQAIPIFYNVSQWHAKFLQQWPVGSAAYDSYWHRIDQGPSTKIEDAFQINF